MGYQSGTLGGPSLYDFGSSHCGAGTAHVEYKNDHPSNRFGIADCGDSMWT